MKKFKNLLMVIAVFAVAFAIFSPTEVRGESTEISYTAKGWEYDKNLWDKTDYQGAGIFFTLYVYSNLGRGFAKQPLGTVYLYPVIFQANGRIDDRIWQSVAFTVKSVPASFIYGGKKYLGMTQLISVSLGPIKDDDQMMYKSISPHVRLEDTVEVEKYTCTVGKSFDGQSDISGSHLNGWSFSAGGKYNASSIITNELTYIKSALQVDSRDGWPYSDWKYDYISDNKTNSNKNAYLVSTTCQSGILSWQGPKNANYYFSGFNFIFSAEYGVALYDGNVRQEYRKNLKSYYTFGSDSTYTSSLDVYRDFTEYAK